MSEPAASAGTGDIAFLLLHSPLVGPASLRWLQSALSRRGYEATLPDCRSSTTGAPPFWPRYVEAATAELVTHRRNKLVIVAHSGAGALAQAVTAQLPSEAGGVVYVDAGLPRPGESWADGARPQLLERLREMTDAHDDVPPWHEWFGGEEALRELLPDDQQRREFIEELRPLSWQMLSENRPSTILTGVPGGYVLLSDAYTDQFADAKGRGWPTTAIDEADHMSTVTRPDAVADAVVSVAQVLTGQAPGAKP